MENPKSIEEQVARTILQQPEEIKVGDKSYQVAPPSIATLILVSEAVSRLPHQHLDDKKVMVETLAIAKDCRALGDVAAILILGAKNINQPIKREQKPRKSLLQRIFGKHQPEEIIETRKEALARELLEEISPRDLHNIVAQLLLQMEVGDFFGLTTFLTEVNLMRQTKVETAPTASGQ